MSVAVAAPISVAATQLNDRLVRAARNLRRAEHELSVLLAEMADSRLYLELGFASLCGYAEAVLDLSARKTRTLAQLGRSLGKLPALNEAFGAGKLAWTKARELLRVVTPETEEAWTRRALALTSRELESGPSGGLPGGFDLPSDPGRWLSDRARDRRRTARAPRLRMPHRTTFPEARSSSTSTALRASVGIVTPSRT